MGAKGTEEEAPAQESGVAVKAKGLVARGEEERVRPERGGG